MSATANSRARVLIVDDDESQLGLYVDGLSAITDLPIAAEIRSKRAAERLRTECFDLLITDLRMPMIDGVDLLRIAHDGDPDLPVLILTAQPSVDTAVESLKLGAADYLTKPVNIGELAAVAQRLLVTRRIQREHRLLQRHMDRPYAFDDFVGKSPAMLKTFDTIQRIADANVDVLIIGETGTGKELVARSLHKRSRHAKKNFVAVDCGAIPEHLLESELFGHEKGAFSGAHARSMGLMEFADGGTFFLDELHALPMTLQAKLSRALQERTFRRVGAKEEITVDLRVVTATNENPAELIKTNRLREDLYYRVNVGRVELPPLRERGSDIALLAQHFAQNHAKAMGKTPPEISPDTLEILLAYRWPGNVRELQNAIKRALALARSDALTPDDLPDEIVAHAGTQNTPATKAFFTLRDQRIAAFEEEYLTELLARRSGDVAAAAREAHVPRGTLYRLMKKYGLASSDFRGTAVTHS